MRYLNRENKTYNNLNQSRVTYQESKQVPKPKFIQKLRDPRLRLLAFSESHIKVLI